MSLRSILVGSVICLVLQWMLFLAGGAVGLSMFEAHNAAESAKEVGWGLGVFAIVGAVLTFAVGGFIAAHFSRLSLTRLGSAVHGFSVFAFVSVFMLFTLGKGVTSSLLSAVGMVGLGGGAAVGVDTVMERLDKLTIVTDLSILRGHVVTNFIVPKTEEATYTGQARELVAQLKREQAKQKEAIEELKDDAKDVTDKVTKASAQASLAGLIFSLIGGLSGVGGGLWGGGARRPRKAIIDHSRERDRARAA